MADIRKFFGRVQPKQNQTEESPVKAGLAKERKLDGSPSSKVTKKPNLDLAKLPKELIISSSDASDGESPLTHTLKKEKLRKETKKRRSRAYISDDEDDEDVEPLLLARQQSSISKKTPVKKDASAVRRTPRKQIILSPPEEPFYSASGATPAHKTSTKKSPQIIVDSLGGVFSTMSKTDNRKRKSSTTTTLNPKKRPPSSAGTFHRESSQGPSTSSSKKHLDKTQSIEVIDDDDPNSSPPKKVSFHDKMKSPTKLSPPVKASTSKSKSSPTKFSASATTSKKVSVSEILLEPHQKKSTTQPAPSKVVGTSSEAPAAIKDTVVVMPWVDKYRPMELKKMVGQQTDKSPMNKLLGWLKDWARNNLGEGAKAKKTKPSPFHAQSDGTAFKAALLSGPPGIGKTTCAQLCCKELGLNFVEMNASDARNKLSMGRHSEQLTTNQMEKYLATTTQTKQSQNAFGIEHVLIMDEVDGMSGNADRAGIAELILMIKRTRVPIICICNDRQSTKIRSLANHCFDLRFQRPRPEQIKGMLMSIGTREKVNVREVLDKVIEASNNDIRQCINTLQMIAGGVSVGQQFQKKDISVNIFDAARHLLSADTNLFQKQEMFFQDYSIMPLFIQDNYPNVRSSRMSNKQHIHSMSLAAESIAFGDIVDKQIRTGGNWSLLVDQSMLSCAIPAQRMDGYLTSQLQFPGWFGKYSSGQKRQRLMRQLALHTHLKTSGSSQALVTDYLGLLRDRLYRPLVKHDVSGVKDVLEVYRHYDLVREDTEAINELGLWPSTSKQKDLAASVSTKAKTALTKALNKEKRLLPYEQPMGMIVKGGRKKAGAAAKQAVPTTIEYDEEGNEIEVVLEAENGDSDNDGLDREI